MGLFGLFYALYTGTRWTAETVVRNSNDLKKSKEARLTGKQYYFSDDGSMRSVVNDHKVIMTTNRNGDNILLDLDTYKEIYNYSQIKRDKEKKDAKESGATVFERKIYKEIGDNSSEALWWNRYGKIFVDFETGATYNVIEIGFETYFLDRKTGLVVRPTDEELFKNDCKLTSKDEKTRNHAMSKMDYIKVINKANEKANTEKGRLEFKMKSFNYDITLGGKFVNYKANFDKEVLKKLYN